MILVTPEAYVDMMIFLSCCPVEISWEGIVEPYGRIDRGELLVKEVIIFEQHCEMAGTKVADEEHFDEQAFHKVAGKLMQEGRGEELNKLRLWGHSHVWGLTSFSGTDLDNIERIGKNVGTNPAGNPWLISALGTKRTDLVMRLDLFHPVRKTFDNMPWQISGEWKDPAKMKLELRKLYLSRLAIRAPEISRLITAVEDGAIWESEKQHGRKE